MPQPLTHLLVDRATISRLQEVSAGSGRWIKAFTPIATDVLFRSYAAGGKEISLGQQLRVNVTHVGYTEPGIDVAFEDQVTVTEKEGTPITGETYRVVAVLQPSLIHHQKLLMEFIARAK